MEKGFKKIACAILGITQRSYSNYVSQNRPIMKLLEKYFSKEDLEEFIEIKKIQKLDELLEFKKITNTKEYQDFLEYKNFQEFKKQKNENSGFVKGKISKSSRRGNTTIITDIPQQDFTCITEELGKISSGRKNSFLKYLKIELANKNINGTIEYHADSNIDTTPHIHLWVSQEQYNLASSTLKNCIDDFSLKE